MTQAAFLSPMFIELINMARYRFIQNVIYAHVARIMTLPKSIRSKTSTYVGTVYITDRLTYDIIGAVSKNNSTVS